MAANVYDHCDSMEHELEGAVDGDPMALLRVFIEQTPNATAMFDRRMRYLAVSEQWITDYGLDDDNLVGRAHYEVFPEIGDRWKRVHQQALAGEVVRADVDRFVRSDGSVQWLRWVVYPWRDLAGHIGGIVISTEDVTELIHPEASAEGVVQWLQLAQAAAQVGTWEWNPRTDEHVWSDALWGLLGLEQGDTAPSHEDWCRALLPEDRARVEHAMREAAERDDEVSVELRVPSADGSVRHLLARGRPVHGATDDSDRRYLGIVIDITERMRAQERLRYSEERYAAVFDRAPFALALARLSDHVLVSVNEAFCRLFEHTREEVIGKTSAELHISDPDSRARVEEELYRHGHVRDLELVHTSRSGQRLVLSTNVDPVMFGGQPHALTTLRDMTAVEQARRALEAEMGERKRVEHELRATVSARDELLAIVSHDLRSPLSTIQLSAHVLLGLKNATQEDPARKAIGVILRSTERMTRLIDDLLAAATIETGSFTVERSPQDVPSLVDEAMQALEPIATTQAVQLHRDVPEELPQILGDRSRVLQVLANLVGNAIKFCHRGGNVWVRARARSGEVCISVRDDGPGIAQDAAADVFDRYRRGPSRDRSGVGLGLYIAKGIVLAHGGRIWVESRRGAGCTFRFTIPTASDHDG